MHTAVECLTSELAAREMFGGPAEYWVPRCLVDSTVKTDLVNVGNPYRFYRKLLADLAANDRSAPDGGWIDEGDLIYLTFLRTCAALNGEIGTPLKQIAFLPMLRRMGVTVMLSLPTGRIGCANRKGSRGSPFAVANPFVLDGSLLDPLLPDVPANVQYRAMVGAYEMAGVRCGSIVPLTTIAMDSTLIRLFPGITYWWRMPVGSALAVDLAAEPSRLGAPDVARPLAPDVAARFEDAPPRGAVLRVPSGGADYWGTADGLTPASACPDVVGDDTGTYTWADVAAVRFDDAAIPRPAASVSERSSVTRSVEMMSLSVAWRAATLGERIFWIDVAPRLPSVVLELAAALASAWCPDSDRLCRALAEDCDPDVVEPLLDHVITTADLSQAPTRRISFIAEELFSFEPTSDLYDAVVGPWVSCVAPFSWDAATLWRSLRHHVQVLADTPPTAPFLVGLGDHDAIPPAAELVSPLLVAALLLPGSVPLIFSGHEHGSQVIVNREFGFNTTPTLRTLRSSLDDSKVALFNDVPMPWSALSPPAGFSELLERLMELRSVAGERGLTSLTTLDGAPGANALVCYRRSAPDCPTEYLTVVINSDAERPAAITIETGERVVLSTAGRALAPGCGVAMVPPSGAVVLAHGVLSARFRTGDD